MLYMPDVFDQIQCKIIKSTLKSCTGENRDYTITQKVLGIVLRKLLFRGLTYPAS
jgi:hypothetical protein